MAVGPYAHPNQINEHRLDALLEQYNSVVGSTTGPAAVWGAAVLSAVNSSLFADTVRATYMADASSGGAVTLTSGASILFESGSTGSSTIDFSTDHESALLVLQSSASMNFTDEGSSGDAGDIIIGGNASQYISIGDSNTGRNTIVAGSGHSTIVGGSHADFMLGGGHTSLVAGTGAETLLGGFTAGANDTFVGGSTGADIMKGKFGSNTYVAGAAATTIKSGFNSGGNASDHISLTAGGTASVFVGGSSSPTIPAGIAHDSVTYGGGGQDSIHVGAGSSVAINIVGETFTGVSAAGGTTTLTFSDGGTLSYDGTGAVTVHFTA